MQNTPENIVEPKKNGRHISILLENLFKDLPDKYITIETLRNSLGDRGFGILMLLFALPNLVPLPIPGLSTILGVPLVVLSFQLMVGHKVPWFPKKLAKQTIPVQKMQKIISYILPYIRYIEQKRILKPRLTFLVEMPAERIIGIICLLMAILISLPIFLGNWFPALAICLFSLAILERDGLFALFGFVSTLIGIILVWMIVLGFINAILFFFKN